MLYDPKWQKAAPFTLPHIIAWLERQPPEKEYSFDDCRGGCLLSLYAASVVGRTVPAGTHDYYQAAKLDGPHLQVYSAASLGHRIAMPMPRTYGAALERARLLQMQGVSNG